MDERNLMRAISESMKHGQYQMSKSMSKNLVKIRKKHGLLKTLKLQYTEKLYPQENEDGDSESSSDTFKHQQLKDEDTFDLKGRPGVQQLTILYDQLQMEYDQINQRYNTNNSKFDSSDEEEQVDVGDIEKVQTEIRKQFNIQQNQFNLNQSGGRNASGRNHFDLNGVSELSEIKDMTQQDLLTING